MNQRTDIQHENPIHTTTEAIREITDASRQMFEAGERFAEGLDALESSVEQAASWRAWFTERPWLLAGGAVMGGILLWRIFR